jgi:hypothetical protein
VSDLLRRLQDAQTNHDSFCFGWLAEAADRIRELEAKVERLECIIERARNGDPQLIDGIEERMAAEAEGGGA